MLPNMSWNPLRAFPDVLSQSGVSGYGMVLNASEPSEGIPLVVEIIEELYGQDVLVSLGLSYDLYLCLISTLAEHQATDPFSLA